MKCLHTVITVFIVFLCCGCTVFETTPSVSSSPTGYQSTYPHSVPVGKNWQIIEEAPELSDERGRLPFQTEQSVQPEGATKPVSSGDKRTIETPPK